MATNKPRITVTLDPNVYQTLDRMAQLQGTSRGKVVSELLDAVHPPLMRTVALLEAAAEAPGQVRNGLRHTVETMERELAGSVGSGLAQLDWLMAEIREESAPAPAGAGRSPAPPTKAKKPRSRPPRSNTGVRSDNPLKSKKAATRRKRG